MVETEGRAQRRSRARATVLDAAERLLRGDAAASFSMRDLAAEAGVSFATPFNHFGNKAAIAQALSARRIDLMSTRFLAAAPMGDVVDRVLAAVSLAVAVMLEEPQINKAVIRSLGFPSLKPSDVKTHSRALWAAAFGDGAGIDPAFVHIAARQAPEHLAIAFRGCLSFWIGDEISDEELPDRARSGALTVLLGFVAPGRRADLMTDLARSSGTRPGK